MEDKNKIDEEKRKICRERIKKNKEELFYKLQKVNRNSLNKVFR